MFSVEATIQYLDESLLDDVMTQRAPAPAVRSPLRLSAAYPDERRPPPADAAPHITTHVVSSPPRRASVSARQEL